MDTLVMTNVAKIAALTELAAGDLLGAEVMLVKALFTPSVNTVIGDLTPADYTGNGNEAVTWLAPSIGDDGEPEIIGTLGEFRPTGTTIGNTIFGGALLETGGALRASFVFADGPVPMSAVTDSILLTLRVRMNPYGGFVVSIL